ncbi:TerB family tellurite resistance protein [Aristophania vespae]|uniref:TerB family tellurite resistance protein n=1 Tax=Aristophania vespae TaxID=2697033 RepID=UPI002351588A|nr:TerB family tellurite resistance protein [Aristophania vespae]UMM63690.1 Co-chaperone protein DjlA [Aristophania vespae]
MAMWGKMFGGAAGFATGGPFGALMGMALGHLADKKKLLNAPTGTWAKNFKAKGTPDPDNAAMYAAAKLASIFGKSDQLFGLSVITLSAKLAKIDGPVSKKEIQAFKTCYRFPEENLSEVGRVFDRARNRTDDYLMYAQELGNAYAHNLAPLEGILSSLFYIARSDLPPGSPLHPRELEYLQNVHKAFGLSQAAWERAERGQSRSNVSSNTPDSYRILGITRSASNEDVRARWRVLIRQYHPDILAQRPMTDLQRAQAQERVAQINAAWDQIKRDRGL